ncbi:MAG: hypothetical protein GC171_01210 [Terrimonas sp.]|nr:hypothetical protein [Terrimonas sp.]
MKFKNLHLILFGILLQISAFAQKDELLHYLPENANFVLHLNLGKLSKKISWDEITQMDFFGMISKKASEKAKTFINQPGETGIDFSAGIYFVFKMAPTGNNDGETKDDSNLMILAKMNDENLFMALVKNNAGKNSYIATRGQNHFMIEKGGAAAWNKSVAMLTISTGKKSGNKLSKKEIKGIEKQLTAMISPAKNNFYTQDTRYQQLVTQDPDIAIWSDGTLGKLGGMKKNPFAALNLGLTNNDGFKATAINFENGKIISTNSNWISDSLAQVMSAILSKHYNKHLLNKLPAGNPLMFMSFSMDMEKMGAYLEQSGISEKLNSMLEKDSIRLSDFRGALEGDFMIAVNIPDKATAPNEETGPPTISGMQFYFVATVKDEDKMNKLIATVNKQVEKAKEKKNKDWDDEMDPAIVDTTINDNDEIPPPVVIDTLPPEVEMEGDTDTYRQHPSSPFNNMKPVMLNEDGLFIFSFSQEAVDAYKNNLGNSNFSELNKNYGASPMLMSIDLKTIMGFALGKGPKTSSGNEDEERMNQFFNSFDKMVIYGGDVEGNRLNSNFEVLFSDPEVNSLKQIMKMFGLVFQSIEADKKKTSSN